MARHLLTGAGSGIGAALADALHARGDELVLLARSEARAEDLADRYAGANTLVADLADPSALAALELPDELDSVVHSAGLLDLAAVEDLTVDRWRETFDVNVVAPAELTRVALPALRAARGTIVFVNSTAAVRAAGADRAAYAGSKYALRALADAVRDEERQHGVRVSSVYPGRTATPMQAKVHEHEGRDYDPAVWVRPETVAAEIVRVLDLPRDATIPDVSVGPT